MATTTNQDQGIASKTSGHEAKANAPDVCFDPPKKVPAPYPNTVPTSRATTHSSGKTLIADGNVVRVYDKIGPPSDPAHAGSGGGVISGTYRMEAVPQAGGPSISAEGKWPARTNDPTTQNKGNTTGTLVDPANPKVVDPLAEQKKKLCTLYRAPATAKDPNPPSAVTLTCAHGRSAGATRILEVFSGSPAGAVDGAVEGAAAKAGSADAKAGEQLTLTAVRKTVDGKDAACAEGNKHTLWRLTRRGASLKALDKEIKGKDTIKIPGDVPNEWLDEWGGVFQAKLKVSAVSDDKKDALQAEAKERSMEAGRQQYAANRAAQGLPPKERNPRSGRQQANADARAERHDMVDGDAAKAGLAKLNSRLDMASKALDMASFIRLWNADKDPLTIVAQAFACSGAETYVIRAYPAGKASLEFGPWLQQIEKKVALVKTVCKGIGTLVAYAGVSLDAEFRALALKLVFELEWDEATEAKNGIELWMMRKKGKVVIAGEIVGVKISVGVHVGYLLGPMGATATKLLNKLGATAEVKLTVDVGLTVNLGMEYDYKQWGPHFSAAGPFSIFFGLSLRSGDTAGVEGGCIIEGGPEFKLKLGEGGKPPFINLENGKVRIGFRGKLWVDIWWWTVEHEETYWPDSWCVYYGERPVASLDFLNG